MTHFYLLEHLFWFIHAIDDVDLFDLHRHDSVTVVERVRRRSHRQHEVVVPVGTGYDQSARYASVRPLNDNLWKERTVL